MAEEKIVSCDKCMCMGYVFFGILAIVYAAVVYMVDIMGWQSYMAWGVGGIILLLIGWAKGSKKS